MMEWKKDGPDPDSEDSKQCILMPAITALALDRSACLRCSLLVATLDDQGVSPRIKVVKFPRANTQSRNIDLSNMSNGRICL